MDPKSGVVIVVGVLVALGALVALSGRGASAARVTAAASDGTPTCTGRDLKLSIRLASHTVGRAKSVLHAHTARVLRVSPTRRPGEGECADNPGRDRSGDGRRSDPAIDHVGSKRVGPDRRTGKPDAHDELHPSTCDLVWHRRRSAGDADRIGAWCRQRFGERAPVQLSVRRGNNSGARTVGGT